MKKTGNPRFCGVELLPVLHTEGTFGGHIHGADVLVWETNKGWLSRAYFLHYGIELKTDLHSASWSSSLLSLRGRIRNFQRALLPFEPKKRKP